MSEVERPEMCKTPVLVIYRREDGGIEVAGPLEDKVACYGLLSVARDIVQAFRPAGRVIPVSSLPPSMIQKA